MPGRLTHVVAGSFAGATVAFFRSAEEPDAIRVYQIFGGFVGGYLGGRVPDMIDCARTPNHRGRAHSVAAGIGLVTVAWDVAVAAEEKFRALAERFAGEARTLPENSFRRALLELVAALCRSLAGFCTGFVAGFVSHLALDGATPRSLALV